MCRMPAVNFGRDFGGPVSVGVRRRRSGAFSCIPSSSCPCGNPVGQTRFVVAAGEVGVGVGSGGVSGGGVGGSLGPELLPDTGVSKNVTALHAGTFGTVTVAAPPTTATCWSTAASGADSALSPVFGIV